MFKKIKIKKPSELNFFQEFYKKFAGESIKFKKKDGKYIFYVKNPLIYDEVKNFLKKRNINFEIKLY